MQMPHHENMNRLGNVHQAMWILTQSQLVILQNKCEFFKQKHDGLLSRYVTIINPTYKLLLYRASSPFSQRTVRIFKHLLKYIMSSSLITKSVSCHITTLHCLISSPLPFEILTIPWPIVHTSLLTLSAL